MESKSLENKIICGDSAEVLATFPNNCIDLTITSPPYDNLRTYDGISWDDDKFYEIAKQLFRVTKDGGVVVWVVGDATVDGSETGSSFRQALYFMKIGFDLHDTMIYEKNSNTVPTNPTQKRYHQIFDYMFVLSRGAPKTWNPIKDRRNTNAGRNETTGRVRLPDGTFRREGKVTTQYYGPRFNIWRYITGWNLSPDKVAFQHPAVFPEKLAEDHILSWSNEGDIVLDPFCGSGTTPKMAHKHGRKWIGIEINQKYVDLANLRIGKHLPQQRLKFENLLIV